MPPESKFNYRLSVKSLHPSNLERQNVKLVLQIFNEYVSQALIQLGAKFNILHYQDTSNFIKIISTWWDVVNVKTPRKGRRLNNKFQQPMHAGSNEPKLFLHSFSHWLSKWETENSSSGRLQEFFLTKETFGALKHTTHALLEIADNCIDELRAEYVLLGKFQTNSLEARFGQYRKLAGGKYDVSLRQVYECEKKLRLLSVLKLKLKNDVDICLSDFEFNWDQYETEIPSPSSPILVSVTEEDINSSRESMPVITYIG